MKKTMQRNGSPPFLGVRISRTPVVLDSTALSPGEANPPVELPDALSRYMRDAVKVPLLTIAEEVSLAARIRAGDESAREHMIRANLRLVVKMARDYEGLGLPLLDLINEGNMGLMKAVERFDPAKGGKLSTYGSWWIKQSIKRAIANQSKTIRLPIHLIEKLTKLRRASMRFQELNGREATDIELATELRTTEKKIQLWKRASMQVASLEAPLGGDEDSGRLADVLADERVASPYEQLEERGNHSMVRSVLSLLDARELTIIRERFGLVSGRERTLDDIGLKFGLTRERIRQVQNIALEKMRRAIEAFEAVRTVSA